MKIIKVTTTNTLQGELTHEVLGDNFCSHSYDSKSDQNLITCIYLCSKTAANKALSASQRKVIINIETID